MSDEDCMLPASEMGRVDRYPAVSIGYHSDVEILQWLVFNSAKVCHDSDGEFSWVHWNDRDGSYTTKIFPDWRAAVMAAMSGEFRER